MSDKTLANRVVELLRQRAQLTADLQAAIPPGLERLISPSHAAAFAAQGRAVGQHIVPKGAVEFANTAALTQALQPIAEAWGARIECERIKSDAIEYRLLARKSSSR
jgi:hypothetical protein